MVKKICVLATVAVVASVQFSCKQKQIVALPGAVVSKDGTNDGLKNVKSEVGVEAGVTTDEGVRYTLSSDVLFATNSSYLSNAAKSDLDNLARVLKQDGNKKIRVDGHTDSTGEADYNQWLSEKRAASVKTYLESAGIAASRMTARGLGQKSPVADNKTPEGRQKNRRVEVVVLK